MLAAPPRLSPDGRRFAAVAASEAGGENSIEIWAISSEGLPRREWRFEVPENTYALYEYADWQSNSRLKLTVTAWIGKELKTLPTAVVRAAGKWSLLEPMPGMVPRTPRR